VAAARFPFRPGRHSRRRDVRISGEREDEATTDRAVRYDHGGDLPISTSEPRVNERITAQRLRVIGEAGEQLGIFHTQDAQKIALEKDLDLVEVAPNGDPPVARIMDYGKFKYEAAIKAKKARKHQATIQIKEIKFRPKIDKHDYETKKKHVLRFLESGAKVKITIMFRGREMVHPEKGLEILDRLAGDLADLAIIENEPKQEGRNVFMLIAPIKVPEKKDEDEDTDETEAPEAEAAE
jgi:translation initiation factor IF-3